MYWTHSSSLFWSFRHINCGHCRYSTYRHGQFIHSVFFVCLKVQNKHDKTNLYWSCRKDESNDRSMAQNLSLFHCMSKHPKIICLYKKMLDLIKQVIGQEVSPNPISSTLNIYPNDFPTSVNVISLLSLCFIWKCLTWNKLLLILQQLKQTTVDFTEAETNDYVPGSRSLIICGKFLQMNNMVTDEVMSRLMSWLTGRSRAAFSPLTGEVMLCF